MILQLLSVRYGLMDDVPNKSQESRYMCKRYLYTSLYLDHLYKSYNKYKIQLVLYTNVQYLTMSHSSNCAK